MIRIRCQKENGKIINLSVKGHAESVTRGPDLICGSVSAVIFGGLNALENPKSVEIKKDEDNGSVEVIAKSNVSNHDYQVLDVILIQLKSIEESYKKYIEVVEKGC